MNSIATSASTTRPARSRNVLPLLLGAMLCTAAAPRTLHAETVQVNVNYHYGFPPATTFGGFEKFDGTLGTLLEVRYQINAFFQYEEIGRASCRERV